MNREIKFRAWLPNIKKMTYEHTIEELTKGNLWNMDGETNCSIIWLQYTGLKDKNGKEIYEGDVVKITGNYKPGTYTVIWDSYRVAWWLKNIKQRKLEYHDDYYQLLNNSWQVEDREVIGNIHENSKLLEASNGE